MWGVGLYLCMRASCAIWYACMYVCVCVGWQASMCQPSRQLAAFERADSRDDSTFPFIMPRHTSLSRVSRSSQVKQQQQEEGRGDERGCPVDKDSRGGGGGKASASSSSSLFNSPLNPLNNERLYSQVHVCVDVGLSGCV